MSSELVKRDRTARLVRVASLLHQHPQGLTARELARFEDVAELNLEALAQLHGRRPGAPPG